MERVRNAGCGLQSDSLGEFGLRKERTDAQSAIRNPQFYMALVHYPVLNRRSEVIASAVTNLDLHDLARLACTYEIAACYIVTPLEDQQALVSRLLDHWRGGVGRELHADRERALRRLRVVESIASVKEDIRAEQGREPVVWATSALERAKHLPHPQARRILMEETGPWLLLLGTAWGLAPAVFDESDAVLEGIHGINGYNHLSVRCAAAILVDRLLRV